MKNLVFARTQAIHIQFLRYFFVGGSAAVVDLLSFAFFTEEMGFHYLVSAIFAYGLGLFWNYILCIFWVFESKHGRFTEIKRIILVAIGGLLWTEILLYVLVETYDLHHLFAKIIALWIVLIWNFVMRKLYVFR